LRDVQLHVYSVKKGVFVSQQYEDSKSYIRPAKGHLSEFHLIRFSPVANETF
jgi:hypothetical protein